MDIMAQKIQPEDLSLEVPRSLKDVLVDEIHSTNYEDWERTGQAKRLDDGVGNLLNRIYAHIEAEALKAFKSNELWAIKAWTYQNILTDAVAKEAAATDETLLDELVSPVKDWQAEHFDPLLNFKRKLKLSGRQDSYIKECLRPATKLVTKYGKKIRYSEVELLEFLDEERKKYCDSSYATRVNQLKTFLDSFPEDERGRKQRLPIDKLPSYPDEFHQPAFTSEEVESLICGAVLDEKPQSVLRLAIATIYGCRVGELAKLSSENINLNHSSPTIDVPTEKKGRRVPQPIPQELIPLFSIPLEHRKSYLIQRDLKRICRKASVFMPHRSGIHSIRRSVVTALYSDTDLKEITIRRFMRWSLGGRDLGVMPRYVKTPAEVTDMEVLEKHPYIPIWKSVIKYIPYLPQYQSNVQFTTIIAG